MPTILVHPAGITKDGMLDIESLIRLRKGVFTYKKLLQEGISLRKVYFVSSVQDRLKEGYLTQSEIIKKLLIDQGIPAEQIVISNQSSNTFDDIRNSFQLIKIHNLPRPVINVSSWYHIPRIKLMWHLLRKQFNYPKVQYISAGVANYFWILLEPIKIFKMWYLWYKLKGSP